MTQAHRRQVDWEMLVAGLAAVAAAVAPGCGKPAEETVSPVHVTPTDTTHPVGGPAPEALRVRVLRQYPHDKDAFTQGLIWHDGVMYESTGFGSDGRSAYEVVEGELHINDSGPLQYEYISRVTDPEQFDALFVEALAARIAADAAEELTQSDNKKRYAMAIYDETLRVARRSDALRRPPRRHAAGTWHRSRIHV